MARQAPWDEVKEELNRVLRAWAHYFSYGTRLMAYRAVDHYVYERAQHFLRQTPGLIARDEAFSH